MKESYPEIKLAYNKVALEFSERELKINKEWKPLYLEFFSNLEKMIVSINMHLNNKIELIKDSPFPQSLFRNTESTLTWFLKFNKDHFWKIELYRENSSQDKTNLPSIEISFDENIDKLKDIIIPPNRIEILLYENGLQFVVKGKFKYIDKSSLSNDLSIKNLNDCLKFFIQFQLAQIKD